MATRPFAGFPAVRTPLRIGYRAIATSVALVAIWAAVVVASIFSPDLVTGSNHEHLTIAAFIGLPLAVAATGMVLLAAGVSHRTDAMPGAWVVFGLVMVLAWGTVLLTSLFAPSMVTGTDPTTIPVPAIIGPIFAVLVTAFASIFIAGGPADQ